MGPTGLNKCLFLFSELQLAMPKRSDTQETVRLALELMRRIPRRNRITAQDLRQQLSDHGIERDIRTIQRQLEMLSEHFDIERDDREKPFGYRWREGSRGLAIQSMSEDESLLLMLAQQHLSKLLPAKLMQSMNSFFEQASTNLMPLASAARNGEWLSKVRVVRETQPLLAPQIKPGVFEQVSHALYNNCWLQLDYQNADAKKSSARVMPLGLAQQGPRLYLVCRFADYDNERTLALHRITLALASSETFIRPKDFNLQKYDADGRFGFGEGKRIQLSFRITEGAGAHLLETPLSLDQEVRKIGEAYQISATVVDTAQLEWWLRGFGDNVSQVKRRAVHAE